MVRLFSIHFVGDDFSLNNNEDTIIESSDILDDQILEPAIVNDNVVMMQEIFAAYPDNMNDKYLMDDQNLAILDSWQDPHYGGSVLLPVVYQI